MKGFARARAAAWIGAALLLLLPAAAVETQQPVPKPSPNQVQTNAFYDWGWGELLYGQTYSTVLTINNLCPMPRPVYFYISDPFFASTTQKDGKRVEVLEWLRPPLVNGRAQREVQAGDKQPVSARAMLSIPTPGCIAVPFGGTGSRTPTTCNMVVPPGATPLDVTITTPAPPDLSGMIFPPGFDASKLFDEIAGELVVYHPGDPPACLPSREEYLPGGHVHLDPNPKTGSGGGPRCRDWWDQERKPRGLTRDCTGEIRDLALVYLRVTLGPAVTKSPATWTWLPSEEQIRTMTIEQLIAMKVRARTQMARN